MSHWAKVACNYFANRKVRRAGADGAYVFVFVLTQNAARGAKGIIPCADLDPWYLSDQLMISEERAAAAVRSCIDVGLIARAADCDDSFAIVGWDVEWARMPLTDAERARRYRARLEPSNDNVTIRHDDSVTRHEPAVTSHDDSVTNHDARDASRIDQRREDQIRREREEGECEREDRENAFSLVPALQDSKPKKPGRAKKPKPDQPTEAERAIARVVLDKLGGHNGIRYEGSERHMQLITRQLRNGLDEMDLRYVVLHCAEGLGWKTDPKMRQHLRPETLFGPETISKYIDAARTLRAEREADERARETFVPFDPGTWEHS